MSVCDFFETTTTHLLCFCVDDDVDDVDDVDDDDVDGDDDDDDDDDDGDDDGTVVIVRGKPVSFVASFVRQRTTTTRSLDVNMVWCLLRRCNANVAVANTPIGKG